MKRYGLVEISKGGIDGAKLQKRLAIMLKLKGFTNISDEKIEEWYRQDCLHEAGGDASVTLHNLKEVRIFKNLMESEFGENQYVKWTVRQSKKKWLTSNRIKKSVDECFEEWFEEINGSQT